MHQKGKTVVQTSYRERREFTRQVKKYVAKLKNRKAAEADKIVNEFMKYGGEGMLAMMFMLYKWMWKNGYAPKK